MTVSKTVTTILGNKTAAPSSATLLADCTELDLSDAISVEIEAEMTFNAGATAGATVQVWAGAATSVYASDPIDEFPVAADAGSTVRVSFQVRASPKYLKVSVENLDESSVLTAITVKSTVQAVT